MIDVERYEASVRSGLTQAPASLRVLSFEFTPELLNVTEHCLNGLSALGAMRANYSLGENMVLAPPYRTTLTEILELLSPYANDTFGDVYVTWS